MRCLVNGNLNMTDFVFIDSGVGGIPYMTTLIKRAPEASCVYVADTANFPYGEKSHEQVVSSVISLVEKICKQFEPSVIVVACNTMTVNALDTLREKFPMVKIVGTVPAIKLAASVSKKRRIGLLATKATCENPYNIELKNKFASDCELICRADGTLVSFIEHNAFTASRGECLAAVKPSIDFFRKEDCDAVILGCTHFLNFTDIFEAACEPDIKVVDSVDGVVRHAIEVGGVAGVAQVKTKTEKETPVPAPEVLQGKTSTSYFSPSLFITGFRDTAEENQYNVLCSRFGIQFGGLLSK